MVDEPEYAAADEPRILLVDDCLKALQQLANYHRCAMKQLKVLGITGTNGKTTTKELIATVLQKKYKVLYTQGNLNNHIGVPLTLLRLTEEHEVAVVEMGANHPGEIRTLVNIVMPDAGLITNVGKAPFRILQSLNWHFPNCTRQTYATVHPQMGKNQLTKMNAIRPIFHRRFLHHHRH